MSENMDNVHNGNVSKNDMNIGDIDIDDIDIDDLDADDIIEIAEWKTPATDYPEKEFGRARISRGKYTTGFYHNYGLRGYEFFWVDKPIDITSLEIKGDSGEWKTWMVDDPPHFWSMQNYAKNSYGKVLVAGLGLGLVTGELLNNTDVNSVTVIELNKDVIGLISPLLPEAVDVHFEIKNEDFYKFINETHEKFDRIIIDLWVTGSAEETLRVLNEDVKPLSFYIMKLFPDASVVFHGFGLSW
jgi:Spermine/spermidine synthase domain